MKITRYFQSCLLVEEGDERILIDPSAHEAENFNKLGKLDAVLYTHEHSDHFDPELAEKFSSAGVALYANASTAKQMKSQPNVVSDGQIFDINALKVQVKELPHCMMWDGSAGPQNSGYVVAGQLFHPGDGKELAGLSVDILALPINGPDISQKDAFDFAKQLSVKEAVPIHYDYLGGNPEAMVERAKSHGFNLHPLTYGESVDL